MVKRPRHKHTIFKNKNKQPTPSPKTERSMTIGHGKQAITIYYQPDGITQVAHHASDNKWTVSDIFGELPSRYDSKAAALAAIRPYHQ